MLRSRCSFAIRLVVLNQRVGQYRVSLQVVLQSQSVVLPFEEPSYNCSQSLSKQCWIQQVVELKSR